MIKNTLLVVAGLLTALIFVLLLRTFTFGSSVTQNTQPLPTIPAIDTDTAAAHLSEALRLRTITVASGDPRPGQDAPWRDLEAFLETTYPAIHNIASKTHIAGYTLLFEWKGTDPSLDPILLMAHQDVVPVNIGTTSDWEHHPFDGVIQDGYVYGRGTLDNKGSLISIMEAANALAADGFQPKRTIFIMLGHDEEVSGSGAQAGVAYLKAKGVHAEMVLDEGFFIISPFPLTGKTAGVIGIAEKGYITIRLTATAKGGHSSTPPRSSGAVQLARAILALEDNQMPADFTKQPMASMIETLAPDMPFMQRMAFANTWLFKGMLEGEFAKDGAANAMIRTTTAPTMLAGSIKDNVLPQKATALVNFRIHPNDTTESVLAHVRDSVSGISGVSADLAEDGIGSEASPVSPVDNRPFAVLSAVSASLSDGAPAAAGLVLGATDARWTTEISENIYRFAPSVVPIEDLAGFHGTNERLSVENVGRLSRGYAQIMKAMASE